MPLLEHDIRPVESPTRKQDVVSGPEAELDGDRCVACGNAVICEILFATVLLIDKTERSSVHPGTV